RLRAAEPAGQDVLRATLSNGLRVVIVRNRLAPVVTTMVNYLVGSNETPAGFPGAAHAQEHMMFRGSPSLSVDQLSDIAAEMGGSFDADTQQTVTQYFYTVPSQDLDVALHIEAIRMSGVDDSQAQWEKERGAIEQEVAQDYSNPVFSFYIKLLEAMYKGTPLSNPGLGTRPSFEKTTAADLKQFYDQWYAPNNAILVVVGDVDPQQALSEVKSLFSAIPSKTLPKRPEFNLSLVQAQTMNLTSDLPYGLAIVSFRLPGTDSPDYAATQVLSDVLSSQRGTLYALVPQGKALFAGFQSEALPQSGLGFALAAYPKGADAPALTGEIRSILTDDLKNGFPADLVEAAKLHELSSVELQKNSVSGLAAAWSEAVAIEGRQSPEDDVKAMQRVTVEDVNRAARKYLTLDNAITAVLTPQPSGKPVSRKSFGGQESFAPEHAKSVPLPGWAQAALERLAVPAPTLHPEVSTLPNGIRLIVQPLSISNTVSVYGHIKNEPDLETPKSQEGVSSVLDRLFSFGTTTLDRIAFQKALDQIGADESAGTDFSLSVLASHFDRGVELLADNELHAALPAQAFQIVKPQMAQAVAGQLESPDYLAGRAVDLGLYPKNDPNLREATPQTVSSLNLTDVEDYYHHIFRPDLTTIVVAGDVTPAEAKAVIEKYFGAWQATGPKPETDLQPVPANAPSATTVPDSSRVQDNVTLAETLGINRFSPDYYALELGNNVLGGGFYASRFSKDLRENAGLVYYVGSSLAAGKTRTIYTVSYGCDPPNVSKARALIVRDLKDMQTSPASSEELRKTKALLLRRIPLAESSVHSIAGGWIARTDLGLPLDEPTRAAEHYVGLTPAQVEAAFSKWIRPGDLVQVVQGPNPQ
ncbi:MAG TPA: pitrilysin family protein, partial [Terriglobia bacterium]|nr:pitrilysin family protein [Terriglobia bacterium]